MRRRIRSIKLKHLNRSGEFPSGNPRYYYRPKGSKGIAMPDRQMDHPEFLAAYAKASGVKPRAPVREGTLASAVQLYKGSDAFALLSAGTRAARRPMLDDIQQMYGHGAREGLAKAHIEKDLSRFAGHVRNNHKRTWRGFCAWMVDHYRWTATQVTASRRRRQQNRMGISLGAKARSRRSVPIGL